MDFDAAISRFVRAANDYCAWLEGAPSDDASEAFSASRLIADLYAAALALPGTTPTTLRDPQVDPVLRSQVWERVKLFPVQYYREFFDPLLDAAEDLVVGDLHDDLIDIYLDVKQGLLLHPECEQDAVFHWRMTMGFHWGKHATSALRALHAYDPEP